MNQELDKEDLERLKILHDKIKNHEFRINPQKYLLDEYADLFKLGLLYKYEYKDGEMIYRYHRVVHDRMLHYKDSHSADGYFHCKSSAEIYSNPNIALFDYATHDFNAIWWKLRANWGSERYHQDLFQRFTETAEKRLILLHNLINGELITSMSFPLESVFSKKECEYKMVQNPLYDNDWTLEKFLHKEWWEDKGFVD